MFELFLNCCCSDPSSKPPKYVGGRREREMYVKFRIKALTEFAFAVFAKPTIDYL
jgi:hypothetical protein